MALSYSRYSKRIKVNSIIVVILLLFSSCSRSQDPVIPQDPSPSSYGKITYLALGDSYTIGQGVGLVDIFPRQLADSLRENGFDMDNPHVIATTGWRTDNLSSAMDGQNIDDSSYTIVSLLIGVNNQFQGRPIEDYRVEFRALLERSIAIANNRADKVFVLSIPDYGVTPFGSSNQAAISAAIDQWNQVNKEITDSLNVQYFDITPISREAETDKSLLASDSLHPSGEMYGRWVELMYADVENIIRKP